MRHLQSTCKNPFYSSQNFRNFSRTTYFTPKCRKLTLILAIIGVFTVFALVVFFSNIIWKFLCRLARGNLFSEARHLRKFFKRDCIINSGVRVFASCKRSMSSYQNNWFFKRIYSLVSVHYHASRVAFVILIDLFFG